MVTSTPSSSARVFSLTPPPPPLPLTLTPSPSSHHSLCYLALTLTLTLTPNLNPNPNPTAPCVFNQCVSTHIVKVSFEYRSGPTDGSQSHHERRNWRRRTFASRRILLPPFFDTKSQQDALCFGPIPGHPLSIPYPFPFPLFR